MSRTPRRRVCIDTGGTFTDLIELDRGRLRVHKTPSTPDRPSDAVLEGLAAFGPASAGGELVHGHTVALNAVLTANGARVALVTNKGFEDLVEIGRQDRPELYALHVAPRPTLVPRRLRFGINERRLADGTHESRATERELDELERRIKKSGCDAIAVCLLHSYAHPEDELRIAEALASLGLPTTCSATLLRRHREFERYSTAILNAFVQPVVEQHLGRIAAGCAPMALSIVRNEGGVMPWRDVVREPVRTLLSGPAGGMLGAAFWAENCGFDRAVGFDMGGTSADVALCVDAEGIEEEVQLGAHSLALPSVPLASVGTGGGSIAWKDKGGALRVGPQSAGARPGPACYGHGGEEATLSDAHLWLGRLPEWGLLGGAFALDRKLAEAALSRLAKELGLDVERAAKGMLEVADLQMARPLRSFTTGRGLDPADVCLVSFGGAGGLHAVRLARLVGFGRVLVPPQPGILSAVGMLLARPVREVERAALIEVGEGVGNSSAGKATRVVTARAGLAQLASQAKSLAAELCDDLPDALRDAQARVRVYAALRYRGNNAEFWVPADRRAPARFVDEFERRYGFVQDLPIECLRLRARATFGRDTRKRIAKAFELGVDEELEMPASRLGKTGLRCLPRAKLAKRWTAGPLAVLDYSGTTIVEEGSRARRRHNGCIELRLD